MDKVKLRKAALQIRTHRVRLGLSPERYGDAIGVSGMTVRRAELGLPIRPDSQRPIAKDLALEIDELFGVPPMAWRSRVAA